MYACNGFWSKSQNIDENIAYKEGIDGDTTPYVRSYSNEWFVDYQYPLANLESSDDIVGIAMNGVFIFTGTSELGYDAFFPNAYGSNTDPLKIAPLDTCLGSFQTF